MSHSHHSTHSFLNPDDSRAESLPEENFQLYSTVYGSGQPLILLHGNNEDGTYFENQIPFLSRHFEVHVVDSRGHGKSPRGTAPFTIRQFARDVADYIDQNGLKAAHILGFSDGANIAMILGMDYPDKVLSLVLDGGNLDLAGLPKKTVMLLKTMHGLSGISRHFKSFHEMVGLMVKDPMIDPEQLERIQAPALVIAGEQDMILPEHTELIARYIPEARRALVKGDHFIARDNPDSFNHILKNFYSSLPSSLPEIQAADE